ncbi:DUF3265 domain-containing protein, partial [Vibrio alginolyticus]
MNVVRSPSFKSSLSCNPQTGICLGFVRTFVDKIHITSCSRGIRNAWHFYYALALVIKVVCGSIGIALAHPLT